MKLSFLIGFLIFSAPAVAANSPTGWRGPVREAGRPWLNNTPYQPASTSNQQAQVVWQWDAAKEVYWTLDVNTGIVWLYSPTSGQYSYYHSR